MFGPESRIVLETDDPFVIAAAKGILDDSGLPFYIAGYEPGTRYATVGLFERPLCRFVVPSDCEARARELLSALHVSEQP